MACTPARPRGSSASCGPSTRTVWLRNLDTGAGPVPGSSLSRVATLGALRRAHGGGDRLRSAGGRGRATGARPGRPAVRRGGRRRPPAAVATAAGPLPGVTRGRHRSGAAADPAAAGRRARSRRASRPTTSGAGCSRRWRPCAATPRRCGRRPPASSASAEAAIFDAHLLLLSDPDLLGERPRARSTRVAPPSLRWRSAVVGRRGGVGRAPRRLPAGAGGRRAGRRRRRAARAAGRRRGDG